MKYLRSTSDIHKVINKVLFVHNAPVSECGKIKQLRNFKFLVFEYYDVGCISLYGQILSGENVSDYIDQGFSLFLNGHVNFEITNEMFLENRI